MFEKTKKGRTIIKTKINMTKKETIKALEYNIKVCKSYITKGAICSEEFRNETKGMIKGYEFAIILLKKKYND